MPPRNLTRSESQLLDVFRARNPSATREQRIAAAATLRFSLRRIASCEKHANYLPSYSSANFQQIENAFEVIEDLEQGHANAMVLVRAILDWKELALAIYTELYAIRPLVQDCGNDMRYALISREGTDGIFCRVGTVIRTIKRFHSRRLERLAAAIEAHIEVHLLPSDFEESPLAESHYLQIEVDAVRRIVTRGDRITDFGNKSKTWFVFHSLFEAGQSGLTREELFSEVWPDKACEDNNIDQQQSLLNKVLAPLRIEMQTHCGRCTLTSL